MASMERRKFSAMPALGSAAASSNIRVVSKISAQPAQVQNRVDPAQQMIARNHLLQIEFIEKAVLPTYRLTHHRRNPPAESETQGNHVESRESNDFFNSLSHKPTLMPLKTVHC